MGVQSEDETAAAHRNLVRRSPIRARDRRGRLGWAFSRWVESGLADSSRWGLRDGPRARSDLAELSADRRRFHRPAVGLGDVRTERGLGGRRPRRCYGFDLVLAISELGRWTCMYLWDGGRFPSRHVHCGRRRLHQVDCQQRCVRQLGD